MFAGFPFAAQPFDFDATLAAWDTSSPDHPLPVFKGRPKRSGDPCAKAWLTLVEEACKARSVPRAHWPAIAVHFMSKKPRGRVADVEKVMRALHGEKWAWAWKDFQAAVSNMGWNLDESKTRQVEVERKSSGLWKLVKGTDVVAPPAPSKKSLAAGTSTTSRLDPKATLKRAVTEPLPSKPSKFMATVPAHLVSKKKDDPKKEKKGEEKSDKKDEKKQADAAKAKQKEKEKKESASSSSSRPAANRSGSLFALPALPFLRPSAPQPAPSALARISAQVPLWLLAAVEAISVVAEENPDVLTAVATAVVAFGSVAAGGSAAVAAIGEAAYVVGRAIKTAQERQHGRGR